MNHKITNEYILDSLQERIDKLAFQVWTRKYNTEPLEKENNKKFNQKYEI